MIRKSLTSIMCIAMIVASCASRSSAITATYISPNTYGTWDCEQISAELIRVNRQIATLEGQQDKIYKNDQIMGWTGSFFLWPLYFLIKGDGEIASELASVKGTHDALEQMQIEKKCGMSSE